MTENKVEVEIFRDGFFVPESVDIGDQNSFNIDENNIDGELCSVGGQLCFYGSLAADLRAQVSRKKLDLESYDSELALQIRSSGEKVTENHIKEKTKVDKKHIELMKEVIAAERDFNKIENLFRSQQKRADCVISLAYKQRTEIKNY